MSVNKLSLARAARLILLVSVLFGCSASEPSARRNAEAQQAAVALQPDKKWFADNLKSPVIENGKYALQCIFKIAEMSGQAGSPPTKYVESLSIKNTRTGEDAVYVPVDGNDSLLFSQGYFAEVWSPDEEYLLLPAGREEGFCIVKASEALPDIQKHRCTDTIKVVSERPGMEVQRLALWHEFVKWESATVFSFNAGLENENVTLRYDIAKRKLFAMTGATGDLIGINRKGRIKVVGVEK
ncbi:MAG TPA: hypothetical protein VGO91_13630 [Pyrinomonadaceae bacterium]|jgi:hypothetical protein|nr:hypothetical protein [Pyrinomonadaceae bacterium]